MLSHHFAAGTRKCTTPCASPPTEAGDDESIKMVGPLRIGIPLFNIYLNEADELSRRLTTELAEWAMEHLVNRRDVWSQYTLRNGEIGVVMLLFVGVSTVSMLLLRNQAETFREVVGSAFDAATTTSRPSRRPRARSRASG